MFSVVCYNKNHNVNVERDNSNNIKQFNIALEHRKQNSGNQPKREVTRIEYIRKINVEICNNPVQSDLYQCCPKSVR